MNIILFGAPGVGKGTQSALLIEKNGMHQISTGDLFRNAMKNETDLGKKAKSYMDAGDLVPDLIVIGMVDEVLENLNGKSFILDGFPRTTPQAEALDELVKSKNIKIDKVISLSVPKEELISRLTGRRLCKGCGAVYHISHKQPKSVGVCDNCGGDLYQRKDDTLEVIENRLATYEGSTAPIKAYYEGKGMFVEVDGLGDANQIYSRIENIIKN